MSREFPSMTALLGLLAIAGYQNRDKIAEMLRGGAGGMGNGGGLDNGAGMATGAGMGQGSVPQTGSSGGLGGMISDILGGGSTGGGLGSMLGGAGAGGFLGNGLRELMERFQQNGMGDAAHSWVSSGPNREITADELERSIGPDVLQSLQEKTGLSRDELLSRLSQDLPRTVDSLTPDGRLPAGA
ncbi:YidB family protein [uncultured Alsobacter sp.]|uniref:YidB family protein n=1 Tax=uncultured Alsobacter sp. TaxID=1748258 RepID=UPI0025CDB546|nr:YidB family protein [uncultured Alsobacter sp.]